MVQLNSWKEIYVGVNLSLKGYLKRFPILLNKIIRWVFELDIIKINQLIFVTFAAK